MNADEFHDHVNSFDGYCTNCQDFTNMGGVEPDAEFYTCMVCDEDTVMGAENALIQDLIDWDEDGEE